MVDGREQACAFGSTEVGRGGEQGAGEAKCAGCERSQRLRWWLAWRWGRNLWRELARRGQVVSMASAKAELRMSNAVAKLVMSSTEAGTAHYQHSSQGK